MSAVPASRVSRLATKRSHREVRPGASRERKSMSVTAYVLIQTEVGRSEKVAKASREIAGVVDSDNVAGPYDVIVKVEAPTLDDLAKVVVSELQKVDGITRTFTCPIVNLLLGTGIPAAVVAPGEPRPLRSRCRASPLPAGAGGAAGVAGERELDQPVEEL